MAKHRAAIIQWYDNSSLHIMDLDTGHQNRIMLPWDEALDEITSVADKILLTCDNDITFNATPDGKVTRIPSLDGTYGPRVTKDQDHYREGSMWDGTPCKIYRGSDGAVLFSSTKGDWEAANTNAENSNGFGTFFDTPEVTVFQGYLCRFDGSSVDGRPLLHRLKLADGSYDFVELPGVDLEAYQYGAAVVRNINGTGLKMYAVRSQMQQGSDHAVIHGPIVDTAFNVTTYSIQRMLTEDPVEFPDGNASFSYDEGYYAGPHNFADRTSPYVTHDDGQGGVALLDLRDGSTIARNFRNIGALDGMVPTAHGPNSSFDRGWHGTVYVQFFEIIRDASSVIVDKGVVIMRDAVTGNLVSVGNFHTMNRDSGATNQATDYTSLDEVFLLNLDAYKIESTVKGAGNVGLQAEVVLIDDETNVEVGRTVCDVNGNYYFRCWTNSPKTVIATHPVSGIKKGSSGNIPVLA